MSARDDYPALFHFAGAWLHQDWDLDYDSVWGAANAFLTEEPTMADDLRREVHQLAGEGRSEEALRALIGEQMGAEYWPPGDGLTYSTWLAKLDEQLSGSPERPE